MITLGSYSSWYDHTRPYLTGQGLWLAGNEVNTLDPSEYDKRPFRVLIARLSTYYDTAESFSHKVLYQIAHRQRGTFPDFAFLPPVNDGPIMLSDNVPWLLGTSTKRGPLDFNLVAFSNATLQELVNVPVMLENSGIPPGKKARLSDGRFPLVILGGSNALNTGIFFTPDPPVDGIFVGDWVECIDRIFGICAKAGRKSLSKQETLSLLEAVPGFVQSDKPRKTGICRSGPPSPNPLLENAPITNLSGNYGAGNLQISDGCPCFCSFCSESFGKKPYREAPANDVLAQARRTKTGMGLDKAELYSFNFNMHSGLRPILEGLARLFPSVGLKSQRFDMLATEPTMLPGLLAIGKSSLTCGLEGISARLRRYLHKSVSEDDLRSSLSRILSSTVRELKIFLLVTGKEEDQDLAEFKELLSFIKQTSTESGKGARIIFSATPLVRFPWTPLEFENAPTPEALRPIAAWLRNTVERSGFEFRMSSDLFDYHLSQILARASYQKMYEALLAAIRRTGYVFYRSVPASFVNAFVESCENLGIPHESMLASAPPDDTTKPWLFMETGVDRKFLIKQHANAIAFVDKGYCLGAPGQQGECKSCGACEAADLKAVTAVHTKAPLRPARLKEFSQQWHDAVEISFLVNVQEPCRGLPRQSAGTALARALMIAEPALVDFYAGYRESFWSKGDQPCWTTGKDIVTLRFRRQGAELVEKTISTKSRLSKVNAAFGRWGTLVGPVVNAPAQWTISVQSPYEFMPKEYFAQKGLPYVLRKVKDGMYMFDFSAKAEKKKLVQSLEHMMTKDGGADIRMTVFDKFDPEEFVKGAFTFGDEREWVRVRVEAEPCIPLFNNPDKFTDDFMRKRNQPGVQKRKGL
jgi:Radical SAM proteins, N-terminal